MLDIKFYKLIYNEVRQLNDIKVKNHWKIIGKKSGYYCCLHDMKSKLLKEYPNFDYEAYVNNNSDLKMMNEIKAIHHFLTNGKNENRIYYKKTIREIQNNTIRYVSGGRLGDFIFQLSIINEIYLLTGKKGILYIANIGDHFIFPLTQTYNELNNIVTKQVYIESFSIYNHHLYDLNLSSWRGTMDYNHSWKTIFESAYHFPWGNHQWLYLNKNEKYKDLILVFSSQQRVNKTFNYNELNKFNKKIYFVTMSQTEYNDFMKKKKLNYELMLFNNLEEFWIAINSCYLFVTNQSSPACVAMALFANTYILLYDKPSIKIDILHDNIKIIK